MAPSPLQNTHNDFFVFWNSFTAPETDDSLAFGLTFSCRNIEIKLEHVKKA